MYRSNARELLNGGSIGLRYFFGDVGTPTAFRRSVIDQAKAIKTFHDKGLIVSIDEKSATFFFSSVLLE